ncbi:semaphorin-5B-like [Mercenaria mercenaria]|uniref:semaphorin-5B-like n=1 Tax=Mercenaria mercenaria TaxID=6596 RepID=UPI00234F762E|nr:semaphorin-5B-like [Mercenaria mercenaria]
MYDDRYMDMECKINWFVNNLKEMTALLHISVSPWFYFIVGLIFSSCHIQGQHMCQPQVKKRVQPQYLFQYGDKCYEYVPSADSWMHARDDCRSKEGHMLSIGSAEEQTFIYNVLTKTYLAKKIWLGLDDRVNEGQWKWDSGDIMNYTHWAPGRYVDPYHDQEDCAIMVMFRYGQWDDVDCNALVHGRYLSYPWICQYNKWTKVSNSTSTVPASWSSWFSGACSVTCGAGTTTRLRRCSTGHEGDCAGKAFETVTCDAGPCPIDGSWGLWQQWSTCSSTCGGGRQIRTRDCDNPVPRHGGANCNGTRIDSSTCSLTDCPHWFPFYEASPCSVTCGVGFIQLKRNCSSGNPHDCPGSEYSEKSCTLINCSLLLTI